MGVNTSPGRNRAPLSSPAMVTSPPHWNGDPQILRRTGATTTPLRWATWVRELGKRRKSVEWASKDVHGHERVVGTGRGKTPICLLLICGVRVVGHGKTRKQAPP